ncbi:MAG: MBL fold metallo-hydrolase [Bacteroidales bacterium]|nr:MBL fold metallo-hydrolase [Bacteroidales bacterium]MCK9448287.1 MBL fold metallo-hydrolase [Bacteroidales bacterium]MDD3701711.1 MBL fold metallo-hydrolase [Bacteroidales bacterium]MDY0369892.1 MBL fold metallo-hydrolase [Bacteroidales bacterium]
MRITVLGSGTSQGVPVVACPCAVCHSTDEKDKRLRSSIMIEENDTAVVIDAGPDFRQQMLRQQVKQLDAILITHTHKDHIAGLDDVRSFNYLSQKPMTVYATKKDQQAIMREFFYAFTEQPYPGVPRIQFQDLTETPFKIGSLEIIPLKVMHMRLEVFGFRLKDFAYITDVNHIPDKTMKLLEGVKVIILDALRKEKHLSHFTLDEAIEVARQLKVEQAYFTHISHLMGFHQQVQNELPDNMSLAWDGLIIDL